MPPIRPSRPPSGPILHFPSATMDSRNSNICEVRVDNRLYLIVYSQTSGTWETLRERTPSDAVLNGERFESFATFPTLIDSLLWLDVPGTPITH